MKEQKDQADGIQKEMLKVNEKVMKGLELTEHEAKLRQYHEQFGLVHGARRFITNVLDPQSPDPIVEDPDSADSEE